jgi:hypothetical protein
MNKENLETMNIPNFEMTFDVKNNIEFYSTGVYDYYNKQNDLKKIVPKKIFYAVELLKDISTVKPSNDKKVVTKVLNNVSNLHFERFGLMLMNFLNANFSSFESAYNTFFYAYGFEGERSKDQKSNELSLVKNSFDSEIEFVKTAKKWFDEHKNNLEMQQQSIKEAVDYIYNLHGDNRDKEIDKKIKLQAYSITELPFSIYSNDYLIQNQNIYTEFIDIDTDNLQKAVNSLSKENVIIYNSLSYIAKSFAGIAYITLKTLVNESSMPITVCQNCGRYFIPQARNDEKYCDYIDLNKNSCKFDGAKKVYNAKKAPVLQEYNKIYQTKFMRMKRNPDNEEYKEQFEKFTTNGNALKKAYRSGDINEKEFIKKLKEIEK